MTQTPGAEAADTGAAADPMELRRPPSLLSTDLQACVQCGLCLTACPTYRLSGMEGYSPRGRIAAIRGSSDSGSAMRSPIVESFVDTCLGCRACEAVCPSGVPYGRILEHARESMPVPGGISRRLLSTVLLWAIARRWRLSVLSLPLWAAQRLGLTGLASSLARRGLAPGAAANITGMPRLRLRNLLVRFSTNYAPAPGSKEAGQVVLFTGCVQDAWSRDVHWATIQVLTTAGYRVRIPHGQVCCGALHAHDGRLDAARSLAAENIEALGKYEGRVVVNAAGCGAKLKEYGDLLSGDLATHLAARVKDVHEVLRPRDVERLGARPPAGLERIAVHDPCHLNFVQKVATQPRALLRAAGYEVVDLPDAGRCCGAAGTYAVHNPEWAEPLREDKLDACRSVTPDAVAVANPGCLYWMAAGRDAPPMYHPIELIAMAMVNARTEA